VGELPVVVGRRVIAVGSAGKVVVVGSAVVGGVVAVGSGVV